MRFPFDRTRIGYARSVADSRWHRDRDAQRSCHRFVMPHCTIAQFSSNRTKSLS